MRPRHQIIAILASLAKSGNDGRTAPGAQPSTRSTPTCRWRLRPRRPNAPGASVQVARRVGVLALVAIAVGCAPRPQVPATELTESVRAAVRDSVVAGQRRYDEALATLDSARVVAFFSDDPVPHVVVGRATFTMGDVAAWAGTLRPTHRSYSGGSVLDSARVIVLSPTSAVLTANNTSVWTDTAGVVSTERGTSTTAWVRGRAGWRIAAAHVVWDPPQVAKP